MRMTAWRLIDDHHLSGEFRFPDFASALDFVNRVGAVAEELDHHPEIDLKWGNVVIRSWTHTTGGVTQKDHELCRRIDALV